MGCNNLEQRMRECRRCGCGRCRDEHRELERQLYSRNYYEPPRIFVDGPAVHKFTRQITEYKYGVDMAAEEPKVDEPKNIAVKLLVDKLKIEQARLESANTSITAQKKTLAVYNASKKEANKNISELANALKKLGHADKSK